MRREELLRLTRLAGVVTMDCMRTRDGHSKVAASKSLVKLVRDGLLYGCGVVIDKRSGPRPRIFRLSPAGTLAVGLGYSPVTKIELELCHLQSVALANSSWTDFVVDQGEREQALAELGLSSEQSRFWNPILSRSGEGYNAIWPVSGPASAMVAMGEAFCNPGLRSSVFACPARSAKVVSGMVETLREMSATAAFGGGLDIFDCFTEGTKFHSFFSSLFAARYGSQEEAEEALASPAFGEKRFSVVSVFGAARMVSSGINGTSGGVLTAA